MAYRRLTAEEIALLERRGCMAESWDTVTVAEKFAPERRFHHIHFSGTVELGVFTGNIRTPDGFVHPAGIEYSALHNVRIGDNCLIRHANLATTDIGDNVVLVMVGLASRDGGAPLGNGMRAHVLTEDGARSVPLWRGLTAQIAHLLCHFKNHPVALALESIVRADSESLRLPRSVISSGCVARRCGKLNNVWIGEGAEIEGAAALVDCYVDSTRQAPARIGEGVAARDCVLLRSSRVVGGVRLDHCLVGEGVVLDDSFSARHSLFFANSHFALGEADAAMAGPHAVSTHKATLVLTCQCSFSTFGSGANSSNHHFKLGPRHGGVLRRGVKCGSGSYVFWPADIGAFTTVVGRHSGHLDTSDFPFSLLLGEPGKSVLVPGVNLFTAGAYRDSAKWRDRDAHAGLDNPLDLVNPAVLSPYVLQAMDAGCELLRRCVGFEVDIRHGGAVIPANRVEPTLRLYETALTFHTGNRLFARAAKAGNGANPDIDGLCRQIAEAPAESDAGSGGRWRDWGGMLLSGDAARAFLADLEAGKFADGAAVRERLRAIHEAYEETEWSWLANRWRRDYGEPTAQSVSLFVDKWRKAALFRHDCFVKDANKEFAPEARFGYGVEEDANTAFARVQGRMADHPLVAEEEAECVRLLDMAKGVPAV